MVKHQRKHSAADRPGPSPSQRYAAFQKRQAHNASVAARFAATLPFDLDDFQQDAIDALERGENVLVAAPTGAGKTVVADFAMYLARERNVKAFYTTPIKALSNQKYHDLTAVYGADRVGLLTGDISINSEADIVVMTTEVLRNMLYEHSTTLNALRFVILDEVHYLADRFRGRSGRRSSSIFPGRSASSDCPPRSPMSRISRPGYPPSAATLSWWSPSAVPSRWSSMCSCRPTTTPSRSCSTCTGVMPRASRPPSSTCA